MKTDKFSFIGLVQGKKGQQEGLEQRCPTNSPWVANDHLMWREGLLLNTIT